MNGAYTIRLDRGWREYLIVPTSRGHEIHAYANGCIAIAKNKTQAAKQAREINLQSALDGDGYLISTETDERWPTI